MTGSLQYITIKSKLEGAPAIGIAGHVVVTRASRTGTGPGRTPGKGFAGARRGKRDNGIQRIPDESIRSEVGGHKLGAGGSGGPVVETVGILGTERT